MKILMGIYQISLASFFLVSVSAVCLSQQVVAEGFDITELDKGKAVTLPHPATTYVPVPHTVILSPTDHGQTLKLLATSVDAKSVALPFQIVIHDPHADGARNVILTPGQPVVYAFKALGPIRLVLNELRTAPSSTSDQGARLQVESNRPLEVRSGLR